MSGSFIQANVIAYWLKYSRFDFYLCHEILSNRELVPMSLCSANLQLCSVTSSTTEHWLVNP